MFRLLMLPLAYACIVGTVFHRWADAHPVISIGIFIFLCALPVLYAVKGICNYVRDIIG